MLARFDRYVLGQLMVVFGFFSFVIVMIFWINKAIGLFDRLVGDGQSLGVFIEFTLLIVPFLLLTILPISAFAASVQVANRLSSESEMVVLRSSGVSAFRLMRPAFIFGLLVFILMLILVHLLVPLSRAQLALREATISQDVASQFLDAGQFMHPARGITIFIGNITPTGILERVMLTDDREKDVRLIYTSDQALLVRTDDGPRLVMIDGLTQILDDENALSVLSFKDLAFDLGDLSNVKPGQLRDLRAYSTRLLFSAQEELSAVTGQSVALIRTELHTRFTHPLNGLFAAVIGFGALLLGAFSRFGFWQQVAGGVVMLVVLQLSVNSVANFAKSSEDAWPILYLPVLIGAVMSIGLVLAADQSLIGRLRRMLARPVEDAT